MGKGKRTLGCVMVIVVMGALAMGCTLTAHAEATVGGQAVPGINLTSIIQAFIALIGAVLTYKVLPYIKAKLSAAQYDKVSALIKVAVYAAEEVYRGGHGDEKLVYVQNYLMSKGYEVDVEQIKAAVKAMRDGEIQEIAYEAVLATGEE